MASNLRVDNIQPSVGMGIGIGTANGSVTFNADVTGGMNITTGSVGVGTDNPTEKLDINGAVKVYANTNIATFKNNQLRSDAAGAYYFDHGTTGQSFTFRTSTSSSLDTTGPSVTSAGNISFPSGKGIDFSTTSDATGMTSELLDDYEEGELGWRLQRTGAIGSGSNHSDTKVTYTKIGNRVYVSGYIYTSNTSNSTSVTVELRDDSNTNNVATLPYVPNQAGGFSITGTRTISDAYRNMAVTFRQGQSQVYIYTDDGNNAYLKDTNNVQITSSQTHLVIQFCGSYTTNS